MQAASTFKLIYKQHTSKLVKEGVTTTNEVMRVVG